MSGRFKGWGAVAVITLIVGAVFFLLTGKPDSPWKAATVSYDPRCGQDCEKLGSTSLTHLGDISLYVQPKVDDAIAQWGDCLDSVTQCVENKDMTAGHIISCVDKSICPKACKVAFSTESGDAKQVNEALDAFERVFINDDALCLPGGENR